MLPTVIAWNLNFFFYLSYLFLQIRDKLIGEGIQK